MEEKVFPKGIGTFSKFAKAPSFVLGTIVIDLPKFKEWINGDGKQWLTKYQDRDQLKLQILQGTDKLNLVVDTYRPKVNEPVADPVNEPVADLVDDADTFDSLPF